jgi:hypothetical protein
MDCRSSADGKREMEECEVEVTVFRERTSRVLVETFQCS